MHRSAKAALGMLIRFLLAGAALAGQPAKAAIMNELGFALCTARYVKDGGRLVLNGTLAAQPGGQLRMHDGRDKCVFLIEGAMAERIRAECPVGSRIIVSGSKWSRRPGGGQIVDGIVVDRFSCE